MDKLKGVAKGGWHPPGDRTIHRETWKQDLKNRGKQKDTTEAARNHVSTPLSTLKDPDAFGAPPRHTGVYGSTPSSPAASARPQASVGLGSVVPTPRQQHAEEVEEIEKPAPGPYRTDTTGLRTDNLPPPPARRIGAAAPATPPRTNSAPAPPPRLPGRQPVQQSQPRPPPLLPPRMTENPDENTPPPPPTYTEAVQPSKQDPASLNGAALHRLGQAGVSVPAFGIGNSASASSPKPLTPQGHSGQLPELQQRFARMGTAGEEHASPSSASSLTSATASLAAHKKPPPPPPPKKLGLDDLGGRTLSSDAGSAQAPPLPLASKPRP